MCAVESCSRARWARAWCQVHYTRWLRHGDPEFVVRPKAPARLKDAVCAVEDCSRSLAGREWCLTHYTRWLRHGDPTFRVDQRIPAESRFWSRVNKTDSCWLWTGALIEGYGNLVVNGRRIGAHRYAYELLVGPIPDGLELDHLCRVRGCCNPAHLEPVTHAENTRRGHGWAYKQRNKTHCPQGHPYDEANTIRQRDGSRKCRACKQARDRAKRRQSA